MPTYRVGLANGLQEKIVVARSEDHARELWSDCRLQTAADRRGMSAEDYRKMLPVEKMADV